VCTVVELAAVYDSADLAWKAIEQQGHEGNKTQYGYYVTSYKLWAGMRFPGGVYPAAVLGPGRVPWRYYAPIGGGSMDVVDFYYWVNDRLDKRPGTCVLDHTC
jgi:hypothetical protein